MDFKRLLKLVEKKGAPIVVVSENGDGYVLVPLASYEALLEKGEAGAGVSIPVAHKPDPAPARAPSPEAEVLVPLTEELPVVQVPPRGVADELRSEGQKKAQYEEAEERFYLEPLE